MELPRSSGRWTLFVRFLWIASFRRAVLATMRELAAEGSNGAHRFPVADLAVAVAAQHAGIDILHFDQHLERLGDHLDVASRWISAPLE